MLKPYAWDLSVNDCQFKCKLFLETALTVLHTFE